MSAATVKPLVRPLAVLTVPIVLAVLTLFIALAAAATVNGGPAAAATTTASATPSASGTETPSASTAVVTVTSLQPAAPAPGQTLRVTGTVTNHGIAALSAVNIQLRLSTTAVGSRSEMATLEAGTGRPPGDPVTSTALALSLAAGEIQPFTLSVQVDQLGLDGPGVYPLAVEVIAADPATGARTRFGTVRTFLPWDMAGVRPTRVAVLWPVSAGPTRDATGVPLGTGLHDQIQGRLNDIVSAADGLDVTWLMDGDTLESAAALATGAPTAAGSASATEAPDPVAATWVTRLTDRTASSQVLALPFADPDVMAVVRAGRPQDLTTATALGVGVTAAVLGRSATGPGAVLPLAWPAEGTAERNGLSAVAASGAKDVLLSDAYTSALRSTDYTPSGIGPLSGTALTGVVADSGLSRMLATPADAAGGAVLGQQRMLAELAMVGLELPSVSRSLVLVPPRGWSPDSRYVNDLLKAVDAAPWVSIAPLADLTADAAAGPARERPSYPGGVRGRELDVVQMSSVREGHQRLEALTAVLTSAQSATDTYTRALLRAESDAWRTDRTGGRRYAEQVSARIGQLMGQVHLIPSGPVTLAARSGRIPLTVVNDLDQQVTLRVGVTAFPSIRLSLVQPAPLVIEAHSSTTLDVAADATANGSVQVRARLLTVNGAPFGPAQTFAVEVTGFGAVAELLVGGALALLSVALALRIVRAVRSGRRPGSGASVRETVR